MGLSYQLNSISWARAWHIVFCFFLPKQSIDCHGHVTMWRTCLRSDGCGLGHDASWHCRVMMPRCHRWMKEVSRHAHRLRWMMIVVDRVHRHQCVRTHNSVSRVHMGQVVPAHVGPTVTQILCTKPHTNTKY